MRPRVAMLRMNTPGSYELHHADPIAQDRPAVNGLVGSTATMPTVLPRARYSTASRVVRVDCPNPGGQ